MGKVQKSFRLIFFLAFCLAFKFEAKIFMFSLSYKMYLEWMYIEINSSKFNTIYSLSFDYDRQFKLQQNLGLNLPFISIILCSCGLNTYTLKFQFPIHSKLSKKISLPFIPNINIINSIIIGDHKFIWSQSDSYHFSGFTLFYFPLL